VKEQEQAKVDLIRAIALEQEKAEIIKSSFQSVVNQKEKFIGELESERNRIGIKLIIIRIPPHYR
jgi:hypothetical protein